MTPAASGDISQPTKAEASRAATMHTYLESAGHGTKPDAPLFQPIRGTAAAITPDCIYKCVGAWAENAKVAVEGLGVHSLRATAATNARPLAQKPPRRFACR
jgi:hypothetical protein